MPKFSRTKKENPSNFDNKNWWEQNPMQYNWYDSEDWVNSTPEIDKVDKSFFENIDKKFFSISESFNKKGDLPFSNLIDFKKINNKKILEIGCGFGSHAQLLINNGKNVDYIGIDITKTAVGFAKRRLEIFNLKGQIIECDAEKLPFKDNEFDFIWSWGVIHHSKNTEIILDEIKRVLKPDGTCTIMIYNKNSLRYYLYGGLFHGVMCLKFLKKNLEEINMEFTDGYFARHFTPNEFKKILLSKNFKVEKIFPLSETDHIPFPGGYKFKKLKINFLNILIDKLLKKFGWFLIANFKKSKLTKN